MSTELRRIKKIVRPSVPCTTEEICGTHSSEDLQRFAKSSLRVVREAAKKELMRRRPNSFPDVPAGHSRRGAIITQKIKVKKRKYKTRRVSEGHVYALTKPRIVDGFVTLTQLASERGIQPQLARIWAKKAGWTPTADGWRFKEGSRDLKRIRKVLGLEP